MITLQDINFTYDTTHDNGLKNISMQIHSGQCILLCGKSGCGKTTLTRVINGLIPNFYEGELTGVCQINGRDMQRIEMYQIAEQVGSVFQNPKSQFFTTDTTSELAFGCENLGVEREEMKRRIAETCKVFAIEDLLNRNIFQLSGGEKQKIACGSVYATQPDIYVLDEPSANLDFQAIAELRTILLTLKKQGKTIIIAEHRLYYLKDLIDEVYYLADGIMEQCYTRAEFIALPMMERQKLGLRNIDLTQVEVQIEQEQKIQIPYIHATNLTFYYHKKAKNPTLIIDDLIINNQTVLGIVGENGAGKTTFAKLLCGLLPFKQGAIVHNGKKLTRKELITNSFLVMQDVNYQLFTESVKEELLLNTDDNILFETVVAHFELNDVIDKHPMSLSGGQKQRLTVASAIMSKKQLVILDEPTSGLDLYHMQQVVWMIKQLKQRGIAVIVISHDYEFISSVCDEIIEIKNCRNQEKYELTRKGHIKLRDYFIQSKIEEGNKLCLIND